MKQTAVEWLQKQLKDVKYNPLEKNGYSIAEERLFNQAKEMEKQQQGYSEEEVLQIIKNAFNQGERYGWDTQFSIGNIDEMKSKIPFISLEKYLETFKNK